MVLLHNWLDKRICYKLLTIIFILLSFLLFSCSFKNVFDAVFLVYLDGANNLDSFAMDDFTEIQNISSSCGYQISKDCVVLVLIDRMYNGMPSYEDWQDTRLYEIEYDNNNNSKVLEIDCKELGLSTLYIDEDCDMGSSKTLRSFCQFAISNYPSSRYILDIWNHGGGWRNNREICSDEESGSVMNMLSIRDELLKIEGLHFEYIILDACNMGTIEVAANFLGLTNAIIFSQGPVPAEGMPYDRIIPIILCENSIIQAGKDICEEYINYYYQTENSVTISALLIDYENRFDNFCKEFLSFLDSISIDSLRTNRNNAGVGAETTVDFSVFSPYDLNLNEQIKKVVFYKYPQQNCGISIYLPTYPQYDKYFFYYTKDKVYFCYKYPEYLNFLNNFSMSDIENIDTYEQNGSKENAYKITFSSLNLQSYIWFENDLYYKIENIPSSGFTIKLTPPSGYDFDIKVYYYIAGSLSVLQSANTGDQMEQIVINEALATKIEELYIVVVGANSSFCQIDYYTLSIE
jgi:hypothetical protein